ncbi:unnamed protein product [Closterium sp. NIES-65]|nr:unnamed protein product [Closterium sp. NIES-65]
MHAIGRQLAVQKVLDARFHPRGQPQLVIGCNEAPNELLLFDLSSGSHRPLQGHACQIQAVECAMDDHAIIFPIALLPCIIQAVEYAMDGDVILYCGGSLLLHSCGPGVAATATATASGNPSIACHRNKIRALAVNQKMSYLAATSGASGDPQVILWDVRVAKPLAHLSPSFTLPPSWAVGTAGQSAPVRVCMAMDVLCCVDSASHIVQTPHSNPIRAVGAARKNASAPVRVRMAVDAPRAARQPPPVRVRMAMDALRFARLTLHVSSSIHPQQGSNADESTWHQVKGGGDGGVALFDSCTHKAITRFSLGGSFEVRGIRGARGRQVTSAALSPFVDCGDEGVNDARWLSASPGFVTATGNGSVAVWDVSLADPLTAFSFAHTRSINTIKQSTCLADKAVALASPSLHGRWRGHPVTPALPFEASQKPILCSSSPSLHDQVAVAPDDACIATGGDDQKVVSAFLSPLLHS